MMIAEIFNKVFSSFLKASDGKVNLIKSKVYGWNFPPKTLARITRVLGFEGKLNWNSFNYLGTPIFKGKKNQQIGKALSIRLKKTPCVE